MSDINKTYVFETVLISGGTTGTTAEFITGATFNPTTGDLNLVTVSGNTISTNFDGRYSFTGHTHTTSEIIDFPTSLSAFTNDEGYITEDSNDYITGATFNISTGEFILTTLSGNTINEFLDGRYALIGDTSTNTDDYVSDVTFNNEILEFSRVSGTTFNVDLSNTYSLTGHTHNINEITNFTDNSTNWDIAYDNSITGVTITGTTTKTITLEQIDGSIITANFDDYTSQNSSDDYTIAAELSGDTLNFTRLSGGTYSVVLSGLSDSTVSGPTIFSSETLSGTTTYVGYGELNACKIRRVITQSGSTYSAFWSEQEEVLDKIWGNRYSYTYF